VKRLFALSGNQCAFPSCSAPLVEESGTVTGVICHISARSSQGPRYRIDQSDEERHSFDNLLLLCARHSKIIDSEPDKYTRDLLFKLKNERERGTQGPVEVSASDAKTAETLLQHYRAINITASGHVMLGSPGGIQASNVVIKTQKTRTKIIPPPGSVASSLPHRNYIKHLIDRYQDFASKQPGRQFSYPAFYASIKRRYGTTWEYISLKQFDDFVSFLQERVDRTMLGGINHGKGIPNYSTFAEYRTKYEAKL
jgi:hypothetical protein